MDDDLPFLNCKKAGKLRERAMEMKNHDTKLRFQEANKILPATRELCGTVHI